MDAVCEVRIPEGLRKVFYVLYSAVMRPIPDTDEKAHERISLIKKMITALEKHGLTESVLRYGFADDIAVFLISGVILNKIGLPDSMVSRWRNILGIEEDGKDCSWFLNDIHRFKIWASTASMNDLIGFIPPSKDEWDNLNLAPMEDLSVVESYVWLRDRYLFGDNMKAREDSSLRKEYKFIHCGYTDAFPERAVEKLGLDEVKLNSEIAKRAVLRSDRSNSRLYMQVYESAKRHLARQEYGAAATLFQFFLKQYPGDTCAQNSRGFCLIPDSPSEAGDIIQDALKRGLTNRCLGYYNLCCCLILQHDYDSALRTAEKYWLEFRNNDDICEALIWEIQDGECTLCDSKNVQLSLVDLCVSISEKIDDKARLHSWISRKNVFIENEKCDIDTESKC